MKIDDSGMAPKAKKMVARAWVDEEFKKRLLTAPLKTCQEEGYLSEEFDGNGRIFHIVENTPTVHNLIVCTLCSCYPTFILGTFQFSRLSAQLHVLHFNAERGYYALSHITVLQGCRPLGISLVRTEQELCYFRIKY